MNFTKNFITSLITMLFTIFLFTNILYAFNLVNSIPLPHLYPNQETDYSDSYFGVSTFLNSWQTFFSHNVMLNGIQSAMNSVFGAITKLDFSNILNFTVNWGTGESFVWDIFGLVLQLFNLLINVPYMIMMIIYLFLFLIYAIMVVIQFILLFAYFVGGVASTKLPNTYGFIQ